MSKMILLFSLLGLALLFSLGLTDPNSPVMWMASTSLNFAYLRLAIMILLASLLVTHPPRNIYLRMFIGLFATSLAAWCLWNTYNNQMKFLDTLCLLQFSISAGLIVLESDYLRLPSEEERLEGARQARRLATSS